MNASTLVRDFKPVYVRFRRPVRFVVLVLGLGAGVGFVSSSVSGGGWLLQTGWGVAGGLLEILWLTMSPQGVASAKQSNTRPAPTLRSRYSPALYTFVALAAIIWLLSLVPAEPSEPDASSATGELVIAILALGGSVFFLVHLWNALTFSVEGSPLTARYLLRPQSAIVGFGTWYAFGGAVVYGSATGLILSGLSHPRYLVPVVSGIVIQVSCIYLVHQWPSLGSAMRDASKFLIRQAILSIFICLGLLIAGDGDTTHFVTTLVTAATLMLLVNAAEVFLLAARDRIVVRNGSRDTAGL
jgi:hypothetical protein